MAWEVFLPILFTGKLHDRITIVFSLNDRSNSPSKPFVPEVFFAASFTTTNSIYLICIGLLRLPFFLNLSVFLTHTHTGTRMHILDFF